jgi:hypothetical protein
MAGNKKRKIGDHTCDDEGCKERINKKDEVIAKKDEVIAKKTEELDQKTNQLADLSRKLEERVTCPVCQEVPTKGPQRCTAGCERA